MSNDSRYGVLRFEKYSPAHENGGGLEMTAEGPDLLILSPQLVDDVSSGVAVEFAYSEDQGQTICFHDDFGHSLLYEVIGPATLESGFEGIEARLLPDNPSGY